MKISNRNYERIEYLYYFCHLYTSYRDFDLAKKIAKHKTMDWKAAESLSNFCNQIVKTKEAKPQDFILDENTKSDKAIEAYVAFKKAIANVKLRYTAKGKDKMLKAVKLFYRKKMYCYEMDSYFVYLIQGLYLYANKLISYYGFYARYCFEVSLFNGKRTPLKVRRAFKIGQYILDL